MRVPAHTSTPSYEDDFHAWALANAALLRAQRFNEIDFENIAEELEGMARSDRRELASRLIVLLAHLLKWTVQPNQRERSKNSWEGTIQRERGEIKELLEASPSLKPLLPEAFAKAYPRAIHEAMRETNLPKQDFPGECPFTPEQILDFNFLPQ